MQMGSSQGWREVHTPYTLPLDPPRQSNTKRKIHEVLLSHSDGTKLMGLFSMTDLYIMLFLTSSTVLKLAV